MKKRVKGQKDYRWQVGCGIIRVRCWREASVNKGVLETEMMGEGLQ